MYQPRPTPAAPTGMHQVIPARSPSIVAVRQGFEAAFGAYTTDDWTLDAECTRPGTDPAMFHPDRAGTNRRTKEALALCAECIVRERCLEDALAFELGDVGAEDVRPEVYGIRGGMTQKDRRRLVQRLQTERQDKLRSEVVAAYAEGEMSAYAIAERHHVSRSTVDRWVAEALTENGAA